MLKEKMDLKIAAHQKVMVFMALIFAGMCFSACEKEPGKGGLATAKGQVFVRDINSAGIVHDSGYGGDIQVDISYGNNTWVDASEHTSMTGEYAFQGLQKGNYTFTVYSRCDSCLLNQVPIQQSIEISSTRQVAVLPDFVIYR
jgi:hypothetical protein